MPLRDAGVAAAAGGGSIAPACAAAFGDGSRPPLIVNRFGVAPVTSTCWPTYLRTFVPVNRYVVPSLSLIMYWPGSESSLATHPTSVTSLGDFGGVCGEPDVVCC